MATAPTKRAAASKPAPKMSKAKSKPAAKGEAKSTVRPAPMDPGRNELTVTIKQISNGWVVREAWYEGKGDKTRFKDRETFSATRPTLKI